MSYTNNRDGKNNIINEITKEELDTSFYFSVKQKDQALFNALSKVYPNEKIERLISIRKFPFFKGRENTYILIDTTLLLEKSYSQFINDFWFDCVKKVTDIYGKPMYPIRYYRGEIGKFMESYTKRIITHSFQNARYHTVKLFEDLKLIVGGNEIEFTDVYIRYNKKIFLAEVKATGLYDEEKYSGDIKAMYKDNRNGFFQSFGVNQLVNAICNLKERLPVADIGFNPAKRYHIYPAIIVNERALQTPLMAHIFNQRFQELLQEHMLDNLKIYPLSIIHISDLEHMEDYLSKKPEEFWNILRYNVREPAFIPPFYNSLNRRNIRPNFHKSKKLFEELVLKYQGKPI